MPLFLAPPPTPESILGYPIGARITNYRDQERVVEAIAAARPDRVRKFVYGKSPEGRPLRVFAISSPKNIANLEKIRLDNARRAKGETVESGPAIVWINQTIHGNEPASFESAMELMHRLADPSGDVATKLDDVVVMLNPGYNPDGHERYAVYYGSVARGDLDRDAFERQEPSIIAGRLNHYRFDLNRDRVSFSQDETRAEFAEMLRWGPQAYVDQHGQVETYFMPPEPMSVNPNVDRARNLKWTTIFGKAIAGAFDRRGFSYFTGDVFDLYYPGYLDASTTLSGSIGMTHETDGSKTLTLAREDGSVWTLARGAEKHLTSALAIVGAAADRRADLLKDYTLFKRRATTGESAGKFRRVVMTGDPRELARLKKQLGYAGIESGFATKAWRQADAHDYWSSKVGDAGFPVGSLVVNVAQSQGALAKALLEPGNGFEPEFVKRQLERIASAPKEERYPGSDNAEFYDTTGWALPYAYNVRAWWTESAPAVETRADVPILREPVGNSSVGYALEYRDREDALAAMEILSRGVRGSASGRIMRVGGRTFPAGTFLFLADRNEDGYAKTVRTIAERHGATLIPLTTQFVDDGRDGPGSESVRPLRFGKVGAIFGDGSNMGGVSGLWWTLERDWKLAFTALSTDILSRPAALAEYDTLLVPAFVGARPSDQLKEWVRDGGRLVVLDGESWATSAFGSLTPSSTETRDLPGSLFRAVLDRRLPASYGYPEGEIAVPVSGGPYYNAPKSGGAAVRLSDDKEGKLLSGWAWPDDTEKNLAGTVIVQDVPSGRGRVTIFTQDPFERAMWPGLHKLVLNAMLF